MLLLLAPVGERRSLITKLCRAEIEPGAAQMSSSACSSAWGQVEALGTSFENPCTDCLGAG